MLIELKTRRRWILSILETAAKNPEGRTISEARLRHASHRKLASGDTPKVTRPEPVAEATR